MAWTLISGIVFVFLGIFQCNPIDFVWLGWTGDYGPHSCLNVNTLTFVAAGFSIAQDLAILVIPLPFACEAECAPSLQNRYHVFMFSLGIFVLITSCVRLRSIVVFGSSLNPTWDYVDTLILDRPRGRHRHHHRKPAGRPLLLGRVLPAYFPKLGRHPWRHRWQQRLQQALRPAGHGLSLRGDAYWSSSRVNPAFGPVKRLLPRQGVCGRWARRAGENESQIELGDKLHGHVQTGWCRGSGTREAGAGGAGRRRCMPNLRARPAAGGRHLVVTGQVIRRWRRRRR